MSIGVAVRNEQTRTPEGLLKAADEALFYAKRSGRNFVASTRDLAARVPNGERREAALRSVRARCLERAALIANLRVGFRGIPGCGKSSAGIPSMDCDNGTSCAPRKPFRSNGSKTP